MLGFYRVLGFKKKESEKVLKLSGKKAKNLRERTARGSVKSPS